MEQLSLAFKKTLSVIAVFIVSFVLVFGTVTEGFAQENAVVLDEIVVNGENSQAGTYTNGPTGETSTDNSQAITNGLAGCAATIVGNAIGGIISVLAAKYASTDLYTRVPQTSANNVKEAGDSNGYYPSLDSIGYCIVNAVIEYITQATIDWINSGFDGNPAFVDNPEQFFKDIGDIEAASFLQQVVQGATGIDICEPFRMQIVTGLAGSHSSSFANRSKCSLDDISSALGSSGVDFDYEDYTSGNSSYGGSLNAHYGVSQNDQNNFIGSFFMNQKELQKRVSMKGNTAQVDLTMGKGFLSVKSCTQDGTTAGPDGKPMPYKGTCRVTTPGGLIEDQANRALGAGRERLTFADEFDEMISALVNQLIKTALSEVLSSGEDEE